MRNTYKNACYTADILIFVLVRVYECYIMQKVCLEFSYIHWSIGLLPALGQTTTLSFMHTIAYVCESLCVWMWVSALVCMWISPHLVLTRYPQKNYQKQRVMASFDACMFVCLWSIEWILTYIHVYRSLNTRPFTSILLYVVVYAIQSALSSEHATPTRSICMM